MVIRLVKMGVIRKIGKSDVTQMCDNWIDPNCKGLEIKAWKEVFSEK